MLTLSVGVATLAVVFLVDPSPAQERRDSERARAAQGLQCGTVMPLVPDQFPTWSDGAGWDDPSRYETIQLADVTGDGKAELLARGPGGVSTSGFDTDTGVWLSLDTTGPLSDEQGWTKPEYYSTIQFADIDGRPGAEMIGRGAAALFTYKWSNADNTWTLLSSQQGLMSNADGWNVPSAVSTIQLADIDGQPGAELVGRGTGPPGKSGTYEYKWNGSSWQQVGFDDLLSDQNGWSKPQYYTTIQLAEVDGQPGAEMLARGAGAVYTRKWVGNGWEELPLTPTFTDDQGGDRPWVFNTMQSADVDGDGSAELFALSPDASEIPVYDWTAGGWQPQSSLAMGSRFGGWIFPRHFETIQGADIDADGQAELLFRDFSGLKTSHYDRTGETWSQPQDTAIPELSDADGFNLPQSFETIQAGDVGGGKRAEVIARSLEGIETFGTTTPAPANNPSFEPTLQPGFTDYSDDPELLAAYRWIGQNAIFGVSTPDIRSHYADLLWADRWVPAGQTLKNLLQAGQTPQGLDPTAFKAVAAQLETEFSYVDDLNTWSTQLDSLLQQIFVDNVFDVIRVPEKMNLPVEGNDAAADLDILSLVSELVEDISGLVPEGGEVVGLVASLTSTSLETAIAASGEPPTIESTVASLEDELQTQSQQAQAANACIQQAFAQNWALLKALGKPISSGAVQWDPSQTPGMARAAQRGYELILWQTLTPAKPWNALDNVSVRDVQPCPFTTPPNPYPADSAGNPYVYWFPNYERDFLAWLIVQGNYCQTAPPAAALSQLFDAPNPDGTGALGVPLPDLHCGVNGWRIPHSGVVNGRCPPPWGAGPPAGAGGSQARASGAPVASFARRKGKRLAARQIRALRGAVSAQVGLPRARRPLLQTLDQAIRLVRRARTTGIPTYSQMAESTLRAFVYKVKAHSSRVGSRRGLRRQVARAHAIRGLLLGLPGGRPPEAQLLDADIKVGRSGAGTIRVRCARGPLGPCRGVVRLAHGRRTIARGRFELRSGRRGRIDFELRRSAALALARRGRLAATARVTTRHMSGRRTASSRRIRLTARGGAKAWDGD